MKNLLYQIKEAKKEAKELTLKSDSCAFGQGWAIRQRDSVGEVEELMAFNASDPITLKAIKEVVGSDKAHAEMWIEGRFVGADNLNDYINNMDDLENGDNINYWEVNIPKEDK
tara:strand:- start:53 stop:391 length:339 start_codon:yes stop_codon:yes gene_type:complete